MTIYRLNRVRTSCTSRCSSCSASAWTAPSAAQTSLRFRLPEVAKEPVTIGASTEVGTPRTATEESIIFQVDESFEVPPRCRPPTCSSAADRSRASGSPTASRSPPAPTSSRFGDPAGRSATRFYLGFEEPLGAPADRGGRGRLAGARGRREPRGPAAALGASPRATTSGLEAEVLEDLTGGFNYGSGTVELELPPRSAISAAWPGPHALAALPDRRQDPPTAAPRRRTRSRRRSTRSPPASWARGCPPPTRRRSAAAGRSRRLQAIAPRREASSRGELLAQPRDAASLAFASSMMSKLSPRGRAVEEPPEATGSTMSACARSCGSTRPGLPARASTASSATSSRYWAFFAAGGQVASASWSASRSGAPSGSWQWWWSTSQTTRRPVCRET